MNDVIVLLNDIYEMSGDSIMDKIIDYCETHDKDPQEVGDLLAESEDFKKIMLKDCIKNNIIQSVIEKNTEDIDIW